MLHSGGMQPRRPNAGLKLPAEKVGALLAELECGDPKIAYGVLDPSAFRSDGGPTIAQRITAGSGGKIHFRPADTRACPGAAPWAAGTKPARLGKSTSKGCAVPSPPPPITLGPMLGLPIN
jgi:hypothetical protein